MKRFINSFLLLILLLIIFRSEINALELIDLEKSDPYIAIATDKSQVEPGDLLNFTINYGNLGSETAKNIKISLNQPIDGRSQIEFISAEPEPDNWLTNEYGNIAEYLIDELETYEATEEGEINILTKVRKSVVTQTLTPSANIYAPFRESGKRLVSSSTLQINIIGEINDELERDVDDTTQINNPQIEKDELVNYSSESGGINKNNSYQYQIKTIVKYVSIIILFLISFVVGRFSVKKKQPASS